ncbi:PorT family protein, partial [Flavobacteriaceae bacterium]|nr:PorT family protein [Flavobacteriaceae bacterium]
MSISIYSQKNKTKISYQQGLDQQKIHFGYFIGLNSYDYKFEESDIKDDREVLKKIGFNVGLIGDLKLK